MARLIKRLYIESFRGIRDLLIEDIGDINIIVGNNNSGKTTLLEALNLLSSPLDFSNIVSVSRLRERYKSGSRLSSNFYDSFMYMFNRLSDEMLISLGCNTEHGDASIKLKGREELLLIDTQESDQYNLFNKNSEIHEEEVLSFIGNLDSYIDDEQISLFNKQEESIPVTFNNYYSIVRMDRKKPYINMKFISPIDYYSDNIFRSVIGDKEFKSNVVQVLKIFDDNIEDLLINQDERGRIIQTIDNKELGYMPLSTYGDGIKKVIALANGIVQASNGVLLVDEIETAIHISAFKEIFTWFIKSCKKFNVQVFMTTHSLEIVDSILDFDSECGNQQPLRVITLVKNKEKTVARVLHGEKAKKVRENYGMELR